MIIYQNDEVDLYFLMREKARIEELHRHQIEDFLWAWRREYMVNLKGTKKIVQDVELLRGIIVSSYMCRYGVTDCENWFVSRYERERQRLQRRMMKELLNVFMKKTKSGRWSLKETKSGRGSLKEFIKRRKARINTCLKKRRINWVWHELWKRFQNKTRNRRLKERINRRLKERINGHLNGFIKETKDGRDSVNKYIRCGYKKSKKERIKERRKICEREHVILDILRSFKKQTRGVPLFPINKTKTYYFKKQRRAVHIFPPKKQKIYKRWNKND